jgi:TRAP-type transport system small permease protein
VDSMKFFMIRPCKFLDRMTSFLGYFIGVLLLMMVAIMFSSVIWRYVLNAPLVWSDQLSRWIFVWMTYLGVAVGYRRGIHIGVDLVVRKVPGALQKILATIVDMGVGYFLLVVLTEGYGITLRSFGQVYGSLELPPSYMYAAAPVSCALMLIFMLDSLKVRIFSLIYPLETEENKC